MKKKLFKRFLVLSFLLITFFSIKIESNAANFAYSDFDWDELLKQNRNYWVAVCKEDDDECVDVVLKTKERFYTRLYEILADVQKKYGYINDNYIIATVFYGLTPDMFSDPDDDENNPYNLDDADTSSTKNKYIGTDDGDRSGAIDYFNKEADSLKSLINNFIGYRSTCYGIVNESPQTYTDSNGNSYKACSSNFTVYGNKCVATINTYKGTFFDSLGLSFLGTENEKKCRDESNDLGYVDYFMETSNEKEINVEFYWNFLENSRYFDNKKHLQSYFDVVLQHTGYKSMDEFWEAADEDDELLEKYKEDIKEARVRIIDGIKSVMETYGLDNFSKLSESFSNASSNLYWWPIGSTETTDNNGTIMATGDPERVDISSKYGFRTDPITGVQNSKHSGIDIPGSLNSTNVIASKDGIVVKATNSDGIVCQDGGDQSCGGGYGNHLIIQHVDGNYTLYAHLASGSINVEMGDSVKQGQVIAKVGNSGSSTGAHLHFEVRIGGNDYSSTQDPLNYVSPTNPRPAGTDNQILEWIGSMEGTGPMEGDYYKVYNDSGGVATVGHGITLKYNADAFRAHGINPDTLSVGSLVPKAVVDAIYQEDVDGRFNNLRGMLSTKGITLSENQIAALASLQFNCGNINGFFEAYEKYGSSQSLCTNWWEQKALHDQSGNYLSGLKKRRVAECDLFVNNNYNMNVYG